MSASRKSSKSSPDRLKPLTVTKLHKLFHDIHAHLESHLEMKPIGKEFAEHAQTLLGDSAPLPAHFLRNQIMSRCYAAPPRIESQIKLYSFFEERAFYDQKDYFKICILRTNDDYELLQACQAADVPPSFWGLDATKVERPERPTQSKYASQKLQYQHQLYYGYEFCIIQSVKSEDWQLAAVEHAAIKKLAKTLQWDCPNLTDMVTKYGASGSTARYENRSESQKSLFTRNTASAPLATPTTKSEPNHEVITISDDLSTPTSSATPAPTSPSHATPTKPPPKLNPTDFLPAINKETEDLATPSPKPDPPQQTILLSDGHTFTCCQLGICDGHGGDAPALSAPTSASSSTSTSAQFVALLKNPRSVIHAAAAIDSVTAPKLSTPTVKHKLDTLPTAAQLEDAEMQAALAHTKSSSSSRHQKSTSIMLAAARIAANQDHPAHAEVERLMAKHKLARPRKPNISSEDAAATDAAVCKSALAASSVMRNLTTKAKQTAPTKAKIFSDELMHKIFYDSDSDDTKLRVASVVVRDAAGEVNRNGRSLWVQADSTNATGEPKWESEGFLRNFKYVLGRTEEVEMYGFDVALSFGKHEADRTGVLGKKRELGSDRNSDSLKKARTDVASAFAPMDQD